MATTPTGLDVPAVTDAFDPDGDIRGLAGSLDGRIIVPVPNITARNALAAALTPTPAAPLYVDRADAPAGASLERTIDGTTWTIFPSSSPWVPLSGAGWRVVPGAPGPAVRFEGDQVAMRGGRMQWASGSAAVAAGTPFTPIGDIPDTYRPAQPEWRGSAMFLTSLIPTVCTITVAGAQVLVTSAASGTIGSTSESHVIIPDMRWARK